MTSQTAHRARRTRAALAKRRPVKRAPAKIATGPSKATSEPSASEASATRAHSRQAPRPKRVGAGRGGRDERPRRNHATPPPTASDSTSTSITWFCGWRSLSVGGGRTPAFFRAGSKCGCGPILSQGGAALHSDSPVRRSFHSKMRPRSEWLGVSVLEGRRVLVLGLVSFCRSLGAFRVWGLVSRVWVSGCRV